MEALTYDIGGRNTSYTSNGGGAYSLDIILESVCYVLCTAGTGKGLNHIQFINDWDLQVWGICIDGLYGLAITNMPRMLPVTQVTMAELGRSLGDKRRGD